LFRIRQLRCYIITSHTHNHVRFCTGASVSKNRVLDTNDHFQHLGYIHICVCGGGGLFVCVCVCVDGCVGGWVCVCVCVRVCVGVCMRLCECLRKVTFKTYFYQ
jgi:hypothetical protein